MSRAQQTPDPLADLREPEPAQGLTTAPQTPPEPQDPPEAENGPQEPVRDVLWHGVAVVQIVERWHNDPVARAQMHGGGTCGCRYAAALALVTVHGAPVAVPAEPEGEPAGGDA